MIRLPEADLSVAAEQALTRWQKEIDDLPDYPTRVEAASKRFSARNRQDNPVFAEVREALTRMCCGAQRCAYCEDSAADEVEHIRPKNLYPEAVFLWQNYAY